VAAAIVAADMVVAVGVALITAVITTGAPMLKLEHCFSFFFYKLRYKTC
jgi:hypothetical protein